MLITANTIYMQQTNLTNQFLIAMPSLKDPNFERTVTYICAHNEEGAMGIVINKPLDIELGEIFEQMDIPAGNTEAYNKMIFHGGPVYTNRGFILHQANQKWDSSIIVSDDICVTTSKDILEAIATGDGPDESLIALGYAGWAGGQLEQELMDNAWLSGPADLEIIFSTPFEQCWQAAADHMGIDIEKLSSDIGHA
jgi:putative transcriptional regulator